MGLGRSGRWLQTRGHPHRHHVAAQVGHGRPGSLRPAPHRSSTPTSRCSSASWRTPRLVVGVSVGLMYAPASRRARPSPRPPHRRRPRRPARPPARLRHRYADRIDRRWPSPLGGRRRLQIPPAGRGRGDGPAVLAHLEQLREGQTSPRTPTQHPRATTLPSCCLALRAAGHAAVAACTSDPAAIAAALARSGYEPAEIILMKAARPLRSGPAMRPAIPGAGLDPLVANRGW